MSWLILGAPPSKERFAVVDAVPTPTPTPLLDAIRARAEICVLRATLSAEMACGVCAANVRSPASAEFSTAAVHAEQAQAREDRSHGDL